MNNPMLRLAVVSALFWFAPPSQADNLENALAGQRWSDAFQTAFDQSLLTPRDPLIRWRAGLALFQKGYHVAAIHWLSAISPSDWEKIPDGRDRLAELIVLSTGRLPSPYMPWRLTPKVIPALSPSLREDALYLLGKEAVHANQSADAQRYLESIPPRSHRYAAARYLLGSLAHRQGDSQRAVALFRNATEGTNEIPTELADKFEAHWGPFAKKDFLEEVSREVRTANALAHMALARVAYAQRLYDTAVRYYSQIPAGSAFGDEATIEHAWTLLLSGRPKEAAAAAEPAVRHTGSIGLEARRVRSLAFTQSGQFIAARTEAEALDRASVKLQDLTRAFRKSPDMDLLPSGLLEQLTRNAPLRTLLRFQKALETELAKLGKEDVDRYPAFSRLALSLVSFSEDSKKQAAAVTTTLLEGWDAHWVEWHVQSALAIAESFLEEAVRARLQGGNTDKTRELFAAAKEASDLALTRLPSPRPTLTFRQAELLWEMGQQPEALTAVERWISENPQHPWVPKALFFLGLGSLEVGQGETGVAALEQLTAKYPTAQPASNAHRLLADIHFDVGEYAEAGARYQAIVQLKSEPLEGYARYRMGWCLYRVGNRAEAGLQIKQGLSRLAEKPTALAPSRQDATDELIRLFADTGESNKALEFFTVALGSQASRALEALAKKFEEAGDLEQSTEVQKGLVALQPDSAQNLARQVAIVRHAFQRRRWQETLVEAARLTKRLGTAVKPTQTQKMLVDAEALLREILLSLHDETAKATKADPEREDRLEQVDSIYLSTFSPWPQAQEPLYRRALWLAARGKAQEALEAFREHWRRYRSSLEEPIREEALRHLIFALEDAENLNKKGGKELSPLAQEILSATGEYAKDYPSSRYARTVAFLRSAMLLKYERFTEGLQESQAIVDESISDAVGRKAYRNLKTGYERRKDWKAAFLWASAMVERDIPEVYREELEVLRRDAAFLYAEGIADHRLAAAEFLKIARDETMGPLREPAFQAAFVRLEKGGQRAEALAAAAELEGLNPASPVLPKIAGLRAALYQEMGDYESALPHLITVLTKGDPATPAVTLHQARLNAGLIYEALGKVADAERCFSELVGQDLGALAVEAKNGLDRLSAGKNRQPASGPSAWQSLEKQRLAFLEHPLAEGNNLVARIKGGGARLERLAKAYLDFSKAKSTPAEIALEAYCAIPLLYAAYTDAITALAQKADNASKGELMLFITPIENQAKQLSQECIAKSADAEHEGELTRSVVRRWGWENDVGLKFLVQRVLEGLTAKAPWLEPSLLRLSTNEILKRHLTQNPDSDSWYALGRSRWEEGKLGLARLTFADSLQRHGRSGRLLNAMALLGMEMNAVGITSFLEEGAKAGSPFAAVNLALRHLKTGRLAPALPALDQAIRAGLFAKNPEILDPAQELLVEFRK